MTITHLRRRLLLLGLALSLSLSSGYVMGGTAASFAYNIPVVKVSPDSPPTVIATWQTGMGQSYDISVFGAQWKDPNLSGSTINVDGVNYPIQRTALPGIGIIARGRLWIDNQNIINRKFSGQNSVIGSGLVNLLNSSGTGGWWANYNIDYALVTIPAEMGALKADNFPQYFGGGPATYITLHKNGKFVDFTYIVSGSILVKATTCDSTGGSSQTLNFDPLSWSAVNRAAVGEVLATMPAPLQLKCDSGAWPKFTLTDKRSSSNSSSTLTNNTYSFDAKGVGAQLFLDGQAAALKLQTPINATPAKLTSEQTVTVPLVAKLVKSGDTVTEGDLDMQADLEFTYE